MFVQDAHSRLCFQGVMSSFSGAGYVFYCMGDRWISRIQLNLHYYLECFVFKDEIQSLHVRNNSITCIYRSSLLVKVKGKGRI